jgi:hypothetical protein
MGPHGSKVGDDKRPKIGRLSWRRRSGDTSGGGILLVGFR